MSASGNAVAEFFGGPRDGELQEVPTYPCTMTNGVHWVPASELRVLMASHRPMFAAASLSDAPVPLREGVYRMTVYRGGTRRADYHWEGER